MTEQQKPEGKIRCAYCGKERPVPEMKQSKLVYRTSRNGRACIETDMMFRNCGREEIIYKLSHDIQLRLRLISILKGDG